MKKKPTIAYLAPGFYKGLYVSIFAGIIEGTREYDANLLCFSGSSHGNLYENDKQANIIFDLVNPGIIDGIVCWTSGLYQKDGYLFDIESLLKRVPHLPFICIGKPLRDFPTLQMDNADGISQLVDHLYTVHGLTKIALIRGPEYHNYAVDRYKAYLDSMKKLNIQVDDRLITKPGNFDRQTGVNGIKYFFNELKLKPKKDIEAIVTVSDLISVGAIDEMKKQGINVPKDVSVVGFNNKEEAFLTTPQITTIDPYFIGIGKNSIKKVLALINKEEVSKEIYIPTKLIIRDSCGCVNSAFFKEKDYDIPAFNENCSIPAFSKSIYKEKERILIELQMFMMNYKDVILYNTEWGNRLFDALKEELSGGEANKFIEMFSNVLEQVLNNNFDIPVWENYISKLRVLILPLLECKELVFKAENIFHNARVFILQKLDQAISIEKVKSNTMDNAFPSISSAIVTTFELPKLMTILEKELPNLGINSCYLSLYTDPQKPLDKSQLILALDEKKHIDITKYNCIFSTFELMPKGLFPEDKRFEILIKPLFFQDNPIGFILYSVGPIDSTIYITLRSYISSALQGSILVKNIGERALELEQAYKTLKDNQQKLVVSEKMASLGRMTAGIAHEMNTPLAAVRASIKELNFLVEEYNKSIDDKSVLPEDHKGIAGDMAKQLNLALLSVEKSVGFIRGIKSQTYNISANNLQFFNASGIINDNLSLLEYVFKKSNSTLVTDLDQDIKLFGDPRYLSQIITNLVINAVDACKPNGGTVTVIFKQIDENNSELTVKDTGSGISQENLSKIFDPFFTTKPFGEGTGLGLSIVHDMVKEYNGHIEVKSKPGETCFIIDFPLKRN